MTKFQTDQHKTFDYKLMQKANPLLFTPERYDQYPLNPTELIQYLTAAPMSSPTISIPRPVTEINEFDYLLYMGNNETSGAGTCSSGLSDTPLDQPTSSSSSSAATARTRFNDIDIERKLACEFAIYLAHMEAQRAQAQAQAEGHITAAPRKNSVGFEDLDRVQKGSREWYVMLLRLLESINATNVNLKSILDETSDGRSFGSGMDIGAGGSGSNGSGVGIGSGSGSGVDRVNGGGNGKRDQKRRGMQDQLQEIISYILSNSIRYGVDVKPNVSDEPAKNDPVVFLKDIIDSVLKQAVDRKKESKTGSNDSDGNGKETSATRTTTDVSAKNGGSSSGDGDDGTGSGAVNGKSNTLKDKYGRSGNNNARIEGQKGKIDRQEELEESKDKRIHELNIALADLQLAHNFLTKQFENDRVEYSKDIEKLTRTNRELQEKLLSYHSDLVKAETKLQKAESKLDSLASLSYVSRSETALKRGTESPSLGLESPFRNMVFPDMVSPLDITAARGTFSTDGFSSSTPGTPVGNMNFDLSSNLPSNSLSIMQNEFKKLLTETQRKYETEINRERGLRLQLEKELEERR